MTRERKMRVTLVLGLSALSVLFTAGLKRSSDHEKLSVLKPKTPSFCERLATTPFSFKTKHASRSISSEVAEEKTEETSAEEKLAEVCANERKLAALKADLERIQKDKDEIIALVERVKEKEEKKTKKKKIKVEDEDQAMLLLLAHRFQMQQQQQSMAGQLQMSLPLPIVTAHSPFHNPSRQDLTNYMQMAMMNRMQFSLTEDQYWHPEWNAQGHMTNPVYGTPQTWSNIEEMYRNPMGNVFSPPPQGGQPTFYFR